MEVCHFALPYIQRKKIFQSFWLAKSVHILLLAVLQKFLHIWLSSSNKLLKNWKTLWKQINHLTQYCLLVCHKKSFQSMRSWISWLENLKSAGRTFSLFFFFLYSLKPAESQQSINDKWLFFLSFNINVYYNDRTVIWADTSSFYLTLDTVGGINLMR